MKDYDLQAVFRGVLCAEGSSQGTLIAAVRDSLSFTVLE